MAWTKEEVDAFVAADKTLVGDSAWICNPDDQQCRLKFTVAVAGVPTNSTFEVIDFPLETPRGFTITLNIPPCIWRLDFDPPEKMHVNDVPDFHQCPKVVYGPHYHSWALNRHLHKGKSIPDELPLALPLDGIRSFKSALDWFCAETNITFSKNQLPELPTSGKLL